MNKDDIMVFVGDLLLMNIDMLLKALAAFGIALPMALLYVVDIVLMIGMAYMLVDVYGIQKKWILRVVVIFNIFHVLISGASLVLGVEGSTATALYFGVLLLEACLEGLIQSALGFALIRLFERRMRNRVIHNEV